ncbi:MAG: alpha-galactosidase [Deltaproteobacteria bacterium]|nr:alpha-galactosidase [Deltaproteobacteria bacterium]
MTIPVAAPVFIIDGKRVSGAVTKLKEVDPARTLANGSNERHFRGQLQADTTLALDLVFRVSEHSPIVRFRYRLSSTDSHAFGSPSAQGVASYFGVSLATYPLAKEVRLAEFVDLFHSYMPHEEPLEARHFQGGAKLIGPLLVASSGARSMVLAYEHGSTSVNAFLSYVLGPDRRVRLEAVKANHSGHVLDEMHPFESLWFDMGAVAGNEDEMAATFREFVRRDLAASVESRKPYIFYNTWNVQEREKQRGKPTYMTTMNTERILADIDVAAAMGVEVFVIDTGWFTNTGDWEVNLKRFPDGLARVRKRLAERGMKFGLWFDPVMAAAAGKSYPANAKYLARLVGKEHKANVWESGDSFGMCLVSDWADVFADRLIQVSRELGVTYFKLDALRTDWCDLPGHHHGDETATAKERADRYAYLLPGVLARMAEKVSAAVPEAIVDLDLTEDGRIMGLQYLTAGKYFLINNGPYTYDYNLPRSPLNVNLFFYPGPARGWIARAPLGYDRWLPSSLLLTHFFPDDPIMSQMNSVGSLVLGGHGIWGDLQEVSREGVARIGDVLKHFKQVRDDMTRVASTRTGALAGSPEVYEKVTADTGKGAVVMFTTSGGGFEYITRAKPAKNFWTNAPATTVSFDNQGHGHVKATLQKNETAIVFFGAE